MLFKCYVNTNINTNISDYYYVCKILIQCKCLDNACKSDIQISMTDCTILMMECMHAFVSFICMFVYF